MSSLFPLLGLLGAFALPPLVVLIVCAVLISRRRRTRTPLAVPAAIAIFILLVICGGGGWTVYGIHEALGGKWDAADPATKATVFSLSISEAMNMSALIELVGLPLLIPAYFLDRRLRRRRSD